MQSLESTEARQRLVRIASGSTAQSQARESGPASVGRESAPAGCLDLVLAAGLARRRGRLEHLDDRRRVLLELLERVLRLLELCLELLEELVVSVLGGLELVLHLRHLGLALGRVHVDVRLQLLELLLGAILLGVNGAARAEVRLDKLLKGRQVAATLVVLALLVGRVEVLDRGVATNAVLVAQRLAGRRAVHVSDEDRLGIRVGRAERVPIGLHLLAVASPRREELDEGGLARLGDLLVEVVGGKLDRARGGGGAGKRANERNASHDSGC